MRFFNFFFNHMPQKYQNEKSPILNGQKKPKTPGKVQKMSDLGGPTSIRPFENTLYISTHRCGWRCTAAERVYRLRPWASCSWGGTSGRRLAEGLGSCRQGTRVMMHEGERDSDDPGPSLMLSSPDTASAWRLPCTPADSSTWCSL